MKFTEDQFAQALNILNDRNDDKFEYYYELSFGELENDELIELFNYTGVAY